MREVYSSTIVLEKQRNNGKESNDFIRSDPLKSDTLNKHNAKKQLPIRAAAFLILLGRVPPVPA
ncbi:MAG: hypothetical protein RR053_05055, partial [Evtepia sp.]